MQVEQVGQAVGCNAMGIACAGIGIDVKREVAVADLQLGIVYAAYPKKYAGLAASESQRCLSCILEGLPGYFQQQPLLGVHTARFPRRDAEEVRVEVIHMFQKSAPTRTHFARSTRIRVVVGGNIPTVCRDFGDGISAITQEPPKSLRVVGSREPAAYTDNGDRLHFTPPPGAFPDIFLRGTRFPP